MLVLSTIACIVATILFGIASTTNIGLLVWDTPSKPMITFFFGGYGIFISFLGAYMMCSQNYDLICCKSEIGEWLCCEGDDCNSCVPNQRQRKPIQREKNRLELTSTIQLNAITVLTSQLFVCAVMSLITIIACISRSSRSVATEILSKRWLKLGKSQQGYAILIQNQLEYECCGFGNDNDAPAQPCNLDKDGQPLPGCGDSLIMANSDMMMQLGISNAFILLFLLLGLYFTYTSRQQALVRTKELKSLKNYEEKETGCCGA